VTWWPSVSALAVALVLCCTSSAVTPDISATISEQLGTSFRSRPRRITPPNVPMLVEDGNPRLLEMYLPSAVGRC